MKQQLLKLFQVTVPIFFYLMEKLRRKTLIDKFQKYCKKIHFVTI